MKEQYQANANKLKWTENKLQSESDGYGKYDSYLMTHYLSIVLIKLIQFWKKKKIKN